MLSRMPPLPVVTQAAPIDTEYERTSGCVKSTVAFDVHRVRLSYPALTHLLAATRQYKVRGRLFGVQIGNTVEVTDLLSSRYEEEEVDASSWEDVLHSEEFDTNLVGRFLISSGTYCDIVFTPDNVAEAMKLYNNSRSPVLLSYDPSRTGLLGRPAIKAFVPTAAYIAYCEAVEKKRPPTSEMTVALMNEGVLREVPVEILVDAFHQLGLPSVSVRPLEDTLSVALSDTMATYMQALLESMRRNAKDLSKPLMEAYKEQPPKLDEKSLLTLQQLREQAEMLEALCDGVLVNTSFLREV